MPVKAYVLIEVEVGESGNVVEKVRKLTYVTSANMLIGPYDVIAVVEVAEFAMVNDIVDRIQSISGVIKTTTLPCAKL